MRIVQCSGLEVQVWNVALVVEPLVIDARPALATKIATRTLATTRANKMSRLCPLDVNLGILKDNSHAKGTPGLPLANRAVAGPNHSGPPKHFVPNRAALAPALIVASHL
jgi:hypothetical protein